MEEGNAGDGWFSYTPCEDADLDYGETRVDYVQLRVMEHAGPFWARDECLSEDFDELHAGLGISRELYDDIMEWHVSSRVPTSEHIARGEALTMRLAREVDVEVGAVRQ